MDAQRAAQKENPKLAPDGTANFDATATAHLPACARAPNVCRFDEYIWGTITPPTLCV